MGRIVWPIRALTLNRGPVCDDLDLAETGLRRLMEAGSRKGFAFIDIAPEWTGDFAESAGGMLARGGWQPLSAPRSSLRLDLSPDLDQLLGSFRKVTRYEIRRSQRQELEVKMAHDERDRDHWLRLHRDMAKKKVFTTDDSGDMRHVLRWLEAETNRGGLLLAHKKDGGLLGGIVIARSGARCWHVWGATSKEGKFSVGHLLHWRAIQWAKERGCSEYDFEDIAKTWTVVRLSSNGAFATTSCISCLPTGRSSVELALECPISCRSFALAWGFLQTLRLDGPR